MTQFCEKCGSDFKVSPETIRLINKISPEIKGVKFQIPLPRLCPHCRKQRRLAFRNDAVLYQRKSSLSGSSVFSVYPESTPFPVYSHTEWWSDAWDAIEYGRPFDFSKPFSEQFKALRDAVPRLSVQVDNLCENCEYCSQLTMSKNCYLLISGSTNELCYYGYRINGCRSCVDCLFAIDSELCYQCIDIFSCYNSMYLRSSSNCQDSSFLYDCQGCHDCLLSYGLRNQSYCIFNERLSKEEYERRKAELGLLSRASLETLEMNFLEYVRQFPQRFAFLKNVENTSGDNIQNANNCSHVFDGSNLENVHYAQFVQDTKDCADVNYCCDNTSWHYDVCTSGINATEVIFSIDTWPNVFNLQYCESCSNGTKHCFGCVGLRRKEYCILNQQYSKEDYESLLPKIIQHLQKTKEWGEFLPASCSPFGYNETVAQLYYPLTREIAHAQGFLWRELESKQYESISDLPPDTIQQTPDDILKKKYSCPTCSKHFRITAQELIFYRNMQLPIPSRCFDCRSRWRLSLRNPRSLWERTCQKCQKRILTSYSPEKPEQIYCESCYLAQIY